MSSFVIGLDIRRNRITAALVRLNSAANEKLRIERDTFCIRLFPENITKDPRVIISGWIDCIDDLLHQFLNSCEEDDAIIGIACGTSISMDYERGICHIQSSKSNRDDRFFGLNLRLLFQSGLRDLIRRRKHHHYRKYYTPPTSPRSDLFWSKQQFSLEELEQITEVKTPSSTSRTTANFSIAPTMNQRTEITKLSIQRLSDYCGLHDNRNDEIVSIRQESIHTTETISPKLSVPTDHFSFKIRTMVNRLSDIPISFFNKTLCFAIGEANNLYHKDYQRILVLTLSNRFGFAFIDQGKIVTNHLYDQNFTADDDCFSTRGLINIYKKLIQRQTDISNGSSLASRALNGDQNAIKAYQIFARHLGQFLIPHIETFCPNLLLIGGGIAQVWYLIENELRRILQNFSLMEIYFDLSNEKSICLGAVQQQLPILLTPTTAILRQTDQYLLPVIKTNNFNRDDFYPIHEIPIGYIGIGHKHLNEKLFRLLREDNILLIDGFLGTYFDEFADKLNEYYFQQRRKTNLPALVFYDTSIFLRTEKITKQELRRTDFDLKKDLIDYNKLNDLQNNLSYPCVVIGPGASFINETSPLIYIDLPKSELHYRIPTQTSYSCLKSNKDDLASVMFEEKCLYSFDTLKQELLPRMNFFIDGQRPNCPTWLDGDTFRQALAHISNQPIRLRPWVRKVCRDQSKFSVNDERVFETITTADGLILSDANHHLVELSWNIFYSSQSNRIVGNAIHHRLSQRSNDFPICFKLFDMVTEGNFEDIGTDFRRDRAYYIIATKQHQTNESETSSSYISLHFYININSDELHENPLVTRRENVELTTEKYSQSIPANKHDCFFVPKEITHASGRNQIILEISTRSNVDNRFQLFNNDHRMNNFQDTSYVDRLRCQQVSIKSEQGIYEEQRLATPNDYIYDIQRLIIEANESIELIRSTENRFHLCILVEGDAIEIEYNSIDNNQDKQIREYNSLEIFLIPASIQEYRLRPRIKDSNQRTKSHRFILLIVFLKNESLQ